MLSSKLQVDQVIDELLFLAVPAIADWCAIDLIEEGARKRIGVFHSNPDKIALAKELDQRFPPKSGDPVFRVLQSGKSELMTRISDSLLELVSQNDDHLSILRTLGLRSYAIVPLMSRGEVIGATTFVTAESGREYSDTELETTEQLGAMGGMTIHNARLYARAVESAEYFESLLRCTGEGIYGIDTKGVCTFVNRAAAELLGYSVEELLGHDMHALIHHHHVSGEVYPVEFCPINRVLQSGAGYRVPGEVFFTKSNHPLPVNYSSFPIKNKGEVTGAVIAFAAVPSAS